MYNANEFWVLMRSGSFKLIIFDLDGTLLDTGRGFVKYIASILGKMGLRENHTLAVTTYKHEDYAVKILEKFGLAQYFDAICGFDVAKFPHIACANSPMQLQEAQDGSVKELKIF